MFIHDGAFHAEESVEKAGFASVRKPGNRDANTFAEDTAIVGGIQKLRRARHGVGDFFSELTPGGGVNPFLGKINPRFKMNHDIEDIATESENLVAESSLELLGSGAEGERGAGANDVHDRLGAGEVDFSVDEGPLGKFTGFGGAGPSAKSEFQCTG